jgi:anti-sigma factor RsiW
MAEHRIIEELDLLAYADGGLDPSAKAAVEARLQASPELAARARDYLAQTAALRMAYGNRAAMQPVPDRLMTVFERRQQNRVGRIAAAAAIVLVTVAAGGAGWLIGQGSDSQDQRPSREFVKLSYDNFVTSTVVGQTPRMAQGERLNWLSQEISLNLRVPDLSHLGYSIVDKRTVRSAEGRVVRMTYTSADGRSFSLFLKPRWNERGRELQISTERQVSVAYWLDGPLVSAVASRLPPDETMAIARAVQGALLDSNLARPTIRPLPTAPVQDGANVATGLYPAGQGPPPGAGHRSPVVPAGPGGLPN